MPSVPVSDNPQKLSEVPVNSTKGKTNSVTRDKFKTQSPQVTKKEAAWLYTLAGKSNAAVQHPWSTDILIPKEGTI